MILLPYTKHPSHVEEQTAQNEQGDSSKWTNMQGNQDTTINDEINLSDMNDESFVSLNNVSLCHETSESDSSGMKKGLEYVYPSKHTRSFTNSNLNHTNGNANVNTLPLVPPVEKLHQHVIPYPFPISDTFHVSWFLSVNTPSLLDQLDQMDQENSLEQSQNVGLPHQQGKDFLDGQSLIGEIGDQPLLSFPPMSQERQNNSFRLERNEILEHSPRDPFENRSLVNETKSLFIEVDTVLLDQSHLNQSYASSYNFQNTWNHSITKTARSSRQGYRQSLTILTRKVSFPHSTPDLNPVLFSCLSDLEEPKPLCWYESADTMAETHYFIEGDRLLFICVDGSITMQNQANSHQEQLSNTNLDNTQTTIQSVYSPHGGLMPVMYLVTYNERSLTHELFILDYIREKQENLTGDLYFKKLDGLENIFDGQRADKVLILQKHNRNAVDSSFSTQYILCLLVNDTIAGLSIDLEINGKSTFTFKIPNVQSMELLRYQDGTEVLAVLQYRKDGASGANELFLSLYDEKYCVGSFSLQNILQNYTKLLNQPSFDIGLMQNNPTRFHLILESLNMNNISENGYSSDTVQQSILFAVTDLETQKASNFFVNLQNLPPQNQLTQDIFQVFKSLLPLDLYAALQSDFIWLHSVLKIDSENQLQQGVLDFNTQKSEIDILFILFCLNLKQEDLAFTIEEGIEDEVQNHTLHRLLQMDTSLFSSIKLATKNDLQHMLSRLKSLQMAQEPHSFEEYAGIILFELHLLSESYQINSSTVTQEEQQYLIGIIILFARCLQRDKYITYYACLYPDIMDDVVFKNVRVVQDWKSTTFFAEPKIIFYNSDMLLNPPSLFKFLSRLLKHSCSTSDNESIAMFPFVRGCDPLDISRKVCRLFWNAFGWRGSVEDDAFLSYSQTSDVYTPTAKRVDQISSATFSSLPLHERLVLTMDQEQIRTTFLQQIGFGLSSIFYDAIVECKKSPKSYWPASVFLLIGRQDISHLTQVQAHRTGLEDFTLNTLPNEGASSNDTFIDTESWCYYDFSDDNTEKYNDDLEQQKQLTRFLSSSGSDGRGIGYEVFNDKRLDQIWAMLSSSCALRQYISSCCTHSISFLIPNSNSSATEGDQLQMQNQLKKQLLVQIISRIIGRGLLTFSTRTINTTENIEIPPIILKAALKRSQLLVDLTDQLQDQKLYSNSFAETTSQNTQIDPLMWASFHNGASQAFSIVGCNCGDTHMQHITREWIVFHSPQRPSNEHAGMLLALGVQGHLNVLDLTDIYHCLRAQHELTSIAVLLGLSASKISSQDSGTTRTLSMHIPSLTSNSDIEIPFNVQTTSILGLGLLYSGSSHRFISEVLFNELIRPPSDTSVNREGYALAAGFALGLCTLGQGTERGPPLQLVDLNLDDRLYHYMIGGSRPSTKESGIYPNSRSYQCTKVLESPHVINIDVTGPGACVALILMYIRSHNKSVVQKLRVPDSVYFLEYLRPDVVLLRIVGANLVGWDWIEATDFWIESNIPTACKPFQSSILEGEEWIRTIYCYALAGCCFTLGLRYAGSGREDVYQLIVKQMKKLDSNKSPSEKPTVNHCIMVCILSLACVMSGRGNVDLVNIILSRRKLLAGQYDFQMAMSMALGINFLGGGRCSFGTTPLATASLLISLYPRFPSHFNDNQFHLQAFRHLYSLAAAPRLLEARDIDTGKPCHIPISITLKNNQVIHATLPSIIPEKNEIASIALDTPAYYKLKIDASMMSTVLDELVLWVRHRSSFLPKTGNKSICQIDTNEVGRDERSILYTSPYESPQALLQFLSTKPSLKRAAAYLSTKSEVIWNSLMEDNSNGIYLHEQVQYALGCNSHTIDFLWNLHLLIENKLFTSVQETSGLSPLQEETTLALASYSRSNENMEAGHDTYNQSQGRVEVSETLLSTSTNNLQYWNEIHEVMTSKILCLKHLILEYIQCKSMHEQLKLVYSYRILGPIVLYLGLHEQLSDETAMDLWNDMILIRKQFPEMPWELAQYLCSDNTMMS